MCVEAEEEEEEEEERRGEVKKHRWTERNTHAYRLPKL